MPITRARIRDPNIGQDEFGFFPFQVIGTGAGERYTTQGGDYTIRTLGGDDTINVVKSWNDGISSLRVEAGPGNDVINDNNGFSGESLFGEAGNDTIRLSSGDDETFARGGDGNDTLVSLGGSGSIMFGDAGNDVLRDHATSYDRMNGGPGKDTIHFAVDDDDTNEDHAIWFSNHTGTGANRDLVFGFDPGEDKLDLSGIDANKVPGNPGNQDFLAVIGVDSGHPPIPTQNVHWWRENGGNDIGVGFNDGLGREVFVLKDMADLSISESDFIL